MLNHLMTQLLRSFGIFFRTIRAFFSRRLVGLWARLRRLTNFSRQATKVASESLQTAATLAKKPTERGDYVETGRLFISKKFLLTLIVGALVLGLALYFVVWPFVLSHFLTARFYVEDSRIAAWTGRVIVYSDEEKTIPLYEGKLEEGLLQGRGKQYDEEGLLEFEGPFVDGLREGKGEEYEAGVILYEGDFSQNVYEGNGKLYDDGALCYEGAFSSGARNGEGTAYYPGGKKRYKGTFADDLYEGTGTEYNKKGEKYYHGGFSQGVYSGEGSLYPAEDQRIDANFADGEPDGSIRWYKGGRLYYDGEADGLTPQGFGTLYAQNGKAAYTGQMAGGTVDGAWLVAQTAEEFRAALGESQTKDYGNVAGGFVIAAPEIGLSALCSYQSADSEAAVYAVYVAEPEDERFTLLPDTDGVTLDGWPEPAQSTRQVAAMQGVRTGAGMYTSQAYALEECRAEVLRDSEEKAVQLNFRRLTAMPVPAAGQSGGAAGTAAAAEQARLESFLKSLDLMAGTGGAQQAPAENPYYGKAAASGALASCKTAADAAQAVDALLTYWENAERRVALENNLTRNKELAQQAQSALASGTGSQELVDTLAKEQTAIQSELNTCIAQMAKAELTATSAGAGDAKQYALGGLNVLFDPSASDVSQLTLLAAAYAQSQGSTVDSETAALSVQTALADLTAAYSTVQTALSSYEAAAKAASAAAGAYATGTGTKATWYSALSAQSDSESAMYAATSAFTRQANVLNELTGGWVTRSHGWLTDVLQPLYAAAGQ